MPRRELQMYTIVKVFRDEESLNAYLKETIGHVKVEWKVTPAGVGRNPIVTFVTKHRVPR